MGLPAAAAGTTRMVLVRHGEPDGSVRGRCYGRLDPGLSARGRLQMRRTWRLLSEEAVTAVYCSPSRRAVESVGMRPTDRPAALVDGRLCEIDFGALEGLTYDEAAARFPEEYRNWMARPTEMSFPGGERFSDMTTRVLEALAHIRTRHPAETIAIVSHGGVNRIALAAALDLEPRRIFRLDQAYGGVNVIDFIDDLPFVRVVNAVAC